MNASSDKSAGQPEAGLLGAPDYKLSKRQLAAVRKAGGGEEYAAKMRARFPTPTGEQTHQLQSGLIPPGTPIPLAAMIQPTLVDGEVAAMLAMNCREFAEALPRLGIPHLNVEGRRLFLRETVDRWLRSHEEQPMMPV